MSFKMDCPHCKRGLKVPENAFGKTLRCPGCSQPVTVPQRPQPPRTVRPIEPTVQPPPVAQATQAPPVAAAPLPVSHTSAETSAQTSRWMTRSAAARSRRKVLWILLGVVGSVLLIWLAVVIVDMALFAASRKRLLPPGERGQTGEQDDAQASVQGRPVASLPRIPVQCFGGASGRKPLSTLDKAALRRATECWNVAKFGDSYYVCEITPTALGGPNNWDWSKVGKTLHELRGPSVTVFPDSLTEADKLNGVTWRGTVTLSAAAVRSFCVQELNPGWAKKGPDKTWGQWYSGGLPGAYEADRDISTVKLEGRNGAWKSDVLGMMMRPVKFEKVVRADLPK